MFKNIEEERESQEKTNMGKEKQKYSKLFSEFTELKLEYSNSISDLEEKNYFLRKENEKLLADKYRKDEIEE